MQIHHLPQDIFPDRKTEQIIFHDYSAKIGTFKGKSILHSNSISMVISGEKTIHFADKKVNIKEDEFHFLSAGNCLASMDLSRQEYFRSILIFFDNHILTNFYIKYATLVTKLKGNHSIKNEPYVAFKKDEFVLNYIHSLKLLFESGRQLSPEMKLIKFEELMMHLLEKYPAQVLSFQPDKRKDSGDFHIQKAVETNIENNITIEEVAFLCNMSLSTFNRKFLKIYGTSPSKWFLQRRMELARNLLLHPDEKPSDVYHRVGYENHSSFSQSFRQAFGMTPREFQQQNLTVGQ